MGIYVLLNSCSFSFIGLTKLCQAAGVEQTVKETITIQQEAATPALASRTTIRTRMAATTTGMTMAPHTIRKHLVNPNILHQVASRTQGTTHHLDLLVESVG